MYARCLQIANVNGFVNKNNYKIYKKVLPELLAALNLALSLAVTGHRCCITRLHSRIVNLILSDRVFDRSHCAIVSHVNEHRFASDLGHLSAIYQNLSASEKLCSVNLALASDF